MRGFVACQVLVLAVAGSAACHREPSALIRRREVTTCSAMSVDTLGTVQCLVRLHNWKPAEARLAAHLRQREMDSTRGRQEDSTWTINAAAHQRDLERCKGREMTDCLTLAGWTDEHAKH